MKIIMALLTLLSCSTLSNAQQGNPQRAADTRPLVMGWISEIQSVNLGEKRTLNIYLPEGYNEEDTVTYPVIYLLDGGVEEDFIHIAGLVRYNTQPWINRFPKSIIVGIENTNRRKDFTFPVANLDFVKRMGFNATQFPAYGGSAKFIAFVEQELQPFIRAQYKTNNRNTIIGESLAGLLATEILLNHRSLFDTYIIMAPSLWWGKESLLAAAPVLLKQGTREDIKVYIGVCSKDEDKIMYDDAVALSEILKQYGGERMKVYYDYLPDEVHATIIHQAVYNAFKMLYPQTEKKK